MHRPSEASGTPVVLLDQTIATIEPGTVSNLEELGIPLAMTGLDHVVEAAGHAIWLVGLASPRPPA